MQNRLPFVPSEQNVTCIFALFRLPVIRLMWYSSTGFLNLSHLLWPIGNSLLTNAQMFGELFLCLRIIFVQRCLQFHIFEFVWWFFHVPCHPSCIVSKSPLLKRRNYHSHVFCDGVCSPWASRSNRYDSAAVFFKWKQKINAVRECSLFDINFDILNTTTCTHFCN